MIRCPLCTKTFRCPATLDIHMVIHTKEKPHKCLKCPSAFGQKSSLTQHIKSVHDGVKVIKKKSFQCPLCSYKCCNKTLLQVHLRKHSDERPFSCDVPSCEFKTKYKFILKQHVQFVHSTERPLECPSDGCSYKAKTRGQLKSHLKIHSNDRPFVCLISGCNYACKRKRDLKNHNFAAHGEGNILKCSDCDYQTVNRPDLRKHQQTHLNIKSFQCPAPSCGYASSQKSNLELHFDSKHRKKEVKCSAPGCNHRCGSVNLLKKHLKIHAHPIFKCPAEPCRFSTKFKRGLDRHVRRRHTDHQLVSEARPKKFVPAVAGAASAVDTILCRIPNCGYKTNLPHHYVRHEITHKKEAKRNHVCKFCHSRFRLSDTLREHIQRHIGEKPYSCSHCKRTTVSSSELRWHAGNIHHIHVLPRGKKEEVNRKCYTCNMTLPSYTEFVLHSMTHLTPVVTLERLRICVL